MDRVRRDVVLVSLRQRQWRIALTVLFMPKGYTLTKREEAVVADRPVAPGADPAYERHEPAHTEHPGYGIWPCPNDWHTTQKRYGDPVGSCPDCPNAWWAADGSDCPDEYALVAEIDQLRAALAAREETT